MRTVIASLASVGLIAQLAADAIIPQPNAWLEYGAPGALLLVIGIVLLRVLPAHQATVEKQAESHRVAAEKIADAHCNTVSTLVKEHKEGLHLIASAHERACDKIVNEIKSCRMNQMREA